MNFVHRLPGPYLILDSSFNPPTIAHRALLHALAPPGHNKLLLLSTANADKKPQPGAFPQRTEMMQLLSQSLQPPHFLPSSSPSSSSFGAAVALIDRATFADKARCAPELKGATWIMGWDTLVRFFAPRYYPNDTMGPVLRTFFLEDQARVVFAHRPAQENPNQENEKQDLLTFISLFLKEHGIPPSCVEEVPIDAEMAEISSSAVRKARKESGDWRRMVPPSIAEYIEQERLYVS
ncbi:Nucleotidylyl transferase [Cylindrobasidium torrendii FP15055 ss-10]|uniref:Nucleotidylyl transferase n=1 Tax=Cylindrobasidium torrendii FP15055 ss-10 TaxID=1314674 RepID=A0A0D7BEY1_9AGAR|nr:Nucleotidylyl transferase [Cylindrobasidium torrendii FP15055 ss-10]